MHRTHVLILLLVTIGIVSSRPKPGDEGDHTHIKIHVPYHIRKHTHTIVKKVYVPVKHHDSHEDEHEEY